MSTKKKKKALERRVDKDWTDHERILNAIYDQAVFDLYSNNPKHRASSIEWFRDIKDDPEYIKSFLLYCYCYDADPEIIRSVSIRKWHIYELRDIETRPFIKIINPTWSGEQLLKDYEKRHWTSLTKKGYVPYEEV